jgi:hypothetical protein
MAERAQQVVLQRQLEPQCTVSEEDVPLQSERQACAPQPSLPLWQDEVPEHSIVQEARSEHSMVAHWQADRPPQSTRQGMVSGQMM